MLRRIVLALLFLTAGCSAAEAPFRTGVLDPPGPAPEFTLRSDTGEIVRLREWRGNVVLLFFGYTSCPDVCPTTLSDLAEVKKQLGPAAQRLRVVLVTVDPDRDTPTRLHTYVQAFDPAFVGLTERKTILAAVWKAYGVYVQSHRVPRSTDEYAVDHSATTFVIDAEGRLRLAISFGTPVADIRHDLKLLLAR